MPSREKKGTSPKLAELLASKSTHCVFYVTLVSSYYIIMPSREKKGTSPKPVEL